MQCGLKTEQFIHYAVCICIYIYTVFVGLVGSWRQHGLKSEIPASNIICCSLASTASRCKLAGPTLGARKHFSSHLRALLGNTDIMGWAVWTPIEHLKNSRVCPCKACHRRCKDVHKDPIGGEKLCVCRMMPNYSAMLAILILRVAIPSRYVFLSVAPYQRETPLDMLKEW